MMDMYSSSLFNYDDLHELCRICGTASNDLNSLFDDNGSSYDFSSKVNEYLPITVRKCDFLPQKICSMCASTLLSFHQLYIVCQSTNARFVQSLEGDAYEHHVTKNQVTGDTSELLELQSSFSREIDHEILLNMHGVKEAFNEAGSEIAANAAVRELERIGSSENISLVEDAAIVDGSSAVNGTAAADGDKGVAKSAPTEKKASVNAAGVVSKAKAVKKPKVNGETAQAKPAEKKPVPEKKQPAKKSQPSVNGSEKDDVHKENVPQKKKKRTSDEAKSKASSPEAKEAAQNVKKEKTTSPKSSGLRCDYCADTFADKPVLVEHIKDVHNDLIFHCETCGDYVARVDLISHMLSHALSRRGIAIKEELRPIEPGTVFAAPQPVADRDATKSDADAKDAKPAAGRRDQPKGRTQHYCAECDKTFADSGGLKYHINSVHNKIKKYECDICGNHFSCKRVIANHLRGVHMKERLFQCNQCSKSFSTDSALYMHKKIHDDVLKCVCKVCDRRFRSMSKLKIHMTMHTKEKNYFCGICKRGFAVRNNLTKHLMTHTKTYDFKCTQCDYAANQRRYLAEHIKRIHKN